MKSGKNIFEGVFKTIVVGGLAVLLFFQFRSEHTFVYVDSVRLLNGYKEMKDVHDKFKAKVDGWNANLDSLKAELEQNMKTYQATQNRLSLKERQLSEELIQKKEDQYTSYQQVISEKIQKEDKELTAQILKKINAYINRYGDAHNYEIIFGATRYGNILYTKKDKDITNEVLEGLNEAYVN